ncbi:MAG: cob(I)yrinic acid a,c-diamide adenosyltransferase [Bacteroidota bacterium]|nr:cob(I)yrinic acid a,c-diamide adenosyltransferase [Bacteroidota bacterium]
MKIYTKSGDKGTTSLFSGKRVKKYNLSIKAYGTIDELNSWIGLLKDELNEGRNIDFNEIQETLFTIGSHLAADGNEKMIDKLPVISSTPTSNLEKSIDLMDVELPEMRNFILPGGHKLSSYCHIARCVCRRAERLVIESIEQNNMSSEIVVFLNRLSDFLFVLARKVLKDHGLDETPWNPKKN